MDYYKDVKDLVRKGSSSKAIERYFEKKNIGFTERIGIKMKLLFDDDVSYSKVGFGEAYTKIFYLIGILIPISLPILGYIWFRNDIQSFSAWFPYLISIAFFTVFFGAAVRAIYSKLNDIIPYSERPGLTYDYVIGALMGTVFVSDMTFLIEIPGILANEIVFYSVVFSLTLFFLGNLVYKLNGPRCFLLTFIGFGVLVSLSYSAIMIDAYLTEWLLNLPADPSLYSAIFE